MEILILKSVEGMTTSFFNNVVKRKFKVKVVHKLGFVLSFL